MADEKPTDKDIQTIQGLVARGYGHMKAVCHFILEVKELSKARKFLADLIDTKQFTTAEVWLDRPKSCLNIGFTFAGLGAMGLAGECEAMKGKAELEAFVQGAVM